MSCSRSKTEERTGRLRMPSLHSVHGADSLEQEKIVAIFSRSGHLMVEFLAVCESQRKGRAHYREEVFNLSLGSTFYPRRSKI